jgi:hypothetical protein
MSHSPRGGAAKQRAVKNSVNLLVVVAQQVNARKVQFYPCAGVHCLGKQDRVGSNVDPTSRAPTPHSEIGRREVAVRVWQNQLSRFLVTPCLLRVRLTASDNSIMVLHTVVLVLMVARLVEKVGLTLCI